MPGSIDAGADAVKVGIGPGSSVPPSDLWCRSSPSFGNFPSSAILPKRVEPRSSLMAASATLATLLRPSPRGRHSVMIGGLFAGLDESPGQRILFHGRVFKAYRGMGSMKAMVQGSRRTVPPGRCSKAGQAGPRRCGRSSAVQRSLGDIRLPACGGAPGWYGLLWNEHDRCTADGYAVHSSSAASVRESHPHDIAITQVIPSNYSTEFAVEETEDQRGANTRHRPGVDS